MVDKKKACFICGTPLHVITSIIVKMQLDIDADIYIYKAFSNTDIIKKNLEKEGVFDSVCVIDREKDFGFPQSGSMIHKYLFALTGYFRIKTIVNKVFPGFELYTDVFFANDQTTDIIDRFIFCYIKKYNTNVNIHFIDDGLGSYNDYFYTPTKLDYWARRLIIGHGTHINDADVYLHSTEIYKKINPSNDRIIHKIDAIGDDTSIILKQVFDYVPDLEDEYNTIVFDTVRAEDYSQVGSEEFNKIVMDLSKDSKTIVKPHPRDDYRYLDLDYFVVEGFPFELLCLKNDFSNYTFINNYSTAVFTPKLLFDQEPKVIFAYKALDDYLLDKRCDRDKFVTIFKELYSEKSKIVVLDKKEGKDVE